MDQPHLGTPFAATADTTVIPTYWPVPGLGSIPMNAFVVHGTEPMLVDTGTAVLSDRFVAALDDLVDLRRLRWIWLTHEDRDHTGALTRLLELAPHATVLGTFMTFGRFAPDGPLPVERTRIVNPGERVVIGDRVLDALRPPIYDSPGTLGYLDRASGVYLSVDAFGAPLADDAAAAHSADEVDPALLRAAQVAWATTDSPWITRVDRERLHAETAHLRRLEPSVILSSHLAPIRHGIDPALDALLAARDSEPTPGLTQAQLEALLAAA